MKNCLLLLICFVAHISGYAEEQTNGSKTTHDVRDYTSQQNFTEVEITIFLEGLYNSGAAEMNKAYEYDPVNNILVPAFDGDIADLITIELHCPDNYGDPVYISEHVALHQNGKASCTIPGEITGEYYLTVKHRNHLETVSSSTISCETIPVAYDFSNNIHKAYGDNLVQLNNAVYGIFAGDLNQDGFVDFLDYSFTLDDVRAEEKGYLTTDLNGDGKIDFLDISLALENMRKGIKKILPATPQ